jgi:hypothetical protein
VSLRARKQRLNESGAPPAPWERLGELEDYEALCRVRLEHLVEVREPLVLISQVQRAGGTLLSQLFDGHPECHADPFELKIGFPKKHQWPALELDRPESWFGLLFNSGSLERLRPTARTRRPDAGRSIFPCLFLPRLQKAIFDACVAARPVESERDVLDCYFTSYFNAWLDNHNLYTGPKKVVTGFTPRLSMELDRVERFFAAYPEGTLISIVRDPRAWYASAHRHRKYYGDLDEAAGLWRQSTEAAMEARERFGARVFLLTYEELIEDPQAILGALADRLGIAFTPELLQPTFNGRPIRANATAAVEDYGILPERVSAYRDSLDADTIARIDVLAGDLYERAASLAGSTRAEGAGGGYRG